MIKSSVNSLLYADDIILLSSADKGLQKSLDVANKFCTDWKLDVNHEKSKVMVFNSNGKSYLNKFKYQDCVLETVKSYSYLGVTIQVVLVVLVIYQWKRIEKLFLRLKNLLG